MSERPYCLSIAGFDPSAGAGLLADIKTMEQLEVYGLGVLTANTIQNDIQFNSVHWTPEYEITHQIDLLFNRFRIEVVKIGLIRSLVELNQVIDHLFKKNNQIKIIWDPILSASAGFQFHTEVAIDLLSTILQKCYLVTPNIPELERLSNGSKKENLESIIRHTNVLLKGGHGTSNESIDTLYTQGTVIELKTKRLSKTEKHGTGCILSSAIAAETAKRNPLKDACQLAKVYTTSIISSNDTKLGYHFHG